MKSNALRILAVEDNPVDLRLLSEYLSEDPTLEFLIADARTLAEAIERLSAETFSIVLLDLDLPDSSGLDGLERLLKIKAVPPIIVMTGLDSEEAGLLAVSKNAQDYLVKGKISSDTLIRSIRYAIERHKADEAMRRLNQELEKSASELRIANERLDVSHKAALNLMEDAEEARNEAVKEKTRLEAVMESLPVGVAIIDERGGNIHSNRMFETIWGGRHPATRSIDDYAAYKAWWTDTGKAVKPEEWASAIAVHGGTAVIGKTMRILRFDGKGAYVLNSAAPIIDAEGRVSGCAVAIQDISGRFEAEKALERSNIRFEFLSHTAGELLQSQEPQKLVESLCRRVMEHLDCQAFFNFLVDDRAGRLRLNVCAGIPEDEARRIEWLDYGAAVCGCSARDACRIVTEHIPSIADERASRVRSYGIKAYACHPLIGEGKRVLGTLSFGTKTREVFSNEDLALMKAVTDQVAVAMIRKKNEQELRASEERYRGLVDLSPSAIFVNRNDRIAMLNPAAIRLLGAVETGQVLGKTLLELFHPNSHAVMRERIRQLEQGQAVPRIEEQIVRLNGDARDVEVAAAPFFDSEGPAMQVVLRDITENKREEEARLKVEKLLKRELKINAALAELSVTLISSDMTIKEIDAKVLSTAKWLTDSPHGYAAIIDRETKHLIDYAISPALGEECPIAMPEDRFFFPVNPDGSYPGLWGHSLNTREPFFDNNPSGHAAARGLPPGHIRIDKFLAVPVVIGSELVGQIALANADHEYNEGDLNTVMRVANLYALAIQRVNYEIALENLNLSLEKRVEERSRELLAINEKLGDEIEERKKAELLLREGEEVANALINTPSEPVLLVEAAGTIIDANEELAKRLGRARKEIIGASMWDILGPKMGSLRKEKINKVIEFGSAVRFDERSGVSWFDTIIYPVRDHQGIITKLAVFSHDITETRRMQKHIMEISELERQRIGQDIHDSLGQKLTGIGFLAEALKQTMREKSYPETGDIEEIIFNITDSIDHARKISSGLWTERLSSYDVARALEELAADTRNLFRIECAFSNKISETIANNTIVTNLYNIARESINNAIKHGKADRVLIDFYEYAGRIYLKITDNGKGAAAGFENKKGIGLNIMRYRAGIIGGSAEFKSENKGFEVLIAIKKDFLDNFFI